MILIQYGFYYAESREKEVISAQHSSPIKIIRTKAAQQRKLLTDGSIQSNQINLSNSFTVIEPLLLFLLSTTFPLYINQLINKQYASMPLNHIVHLRVEGMMCQKNCGKKKHGSCCTRGRASFFGYLS